MKILIIIAVFTVICEGANLHQSLFHALIRAADGDLLDSETKCTGDKIRECSSCTEAKICLPNGIPIGKMNCSSFNPLKPFCNPKDGLCTDQKSSMCKANDTSNSFPCPSEDGTYPDPSDCTQFHFCAGGTSLTIVCPTQNVYDHSTQTCKLRRKTTDCVTFNCANKEGEDVVYPSDDRIWGTCAGGKAYILGRCKEYEKYDVAERKCSRVCRSVENQPIEGTCDSYIRCAEVGIGKFEPVKFPCPPGQGFDTVKKLCSPNVSCPAPSDDHQVDGGNELEADSESENNNKSNSATPNGRSISSRINNSGNQNSNNDVTNGNDNVDGNLVNGNGNNENWNSGNIESGNHGGILPRIINNAGSNNATNNIENGDGNMNGDLINGNNNGNNVNVGNEGNVLSLIRINNSGNKNSDNNVTNGDDKIKGNIVNGNNNSDNTNDGNVESGNGNRPSPRINNSGNENSNNAVINGNDEMNGNLVNGNDNSGNSNNGNVGSGNRNGSSPRINNSGDNNDHNIIINGDDDVKGNVVNGNDNIGNSNSGDSNTGN